VKSSYGPRAAGAQALDAYADINIDCWQKAGDVAKRVLRRCSITAPEPAIADAFGQALDQRSGLQP
jgi:hypothetical protein